MVRIIFKYLNSFKLVFAKFVLFSSVLIIGTSCIYKEKSHIDNDFLSNVKFSESNTSISITSSTVISGASTNLIITLKDQNGKNIIPKENQIFDIQINFSGGSSSGTLSEITNNYDGTFSTQFTGGKSGSATTIGATVNGKSITSVLPLVTVVPGVLSLNGSAITVSSSSIQSGSMISAILQIKDDAGNDLSDSTLNVVFTQSGGTSAGTFSSVTNNNNGSYSANFLATTSGSATTIGATINGKSLIGTLPTIIVTPSGSSTLYSSISASSTSLAVGNSTTLTITIKDAYNNPISGQTVTISSTGSGNTIIQPVLTTDSNGQTTATLNSTTSEIKTVSIATPINLNSISTNVTYLPQPPGAFSISGITAYSSSAAISWANAANATSYTVKYGTSSGSYPNTASTNATSPYTVSSLNGNQTYYFMVIASNTGGSTNASSESSATTDSTAPTITSINSSTSNGSYTTGASIAVQVNFSESVVVTGTPSLKIATGGSGTLVNYASGSGTSSLTFTYIVSAGDTSSDLDIFSTSSLTLPSGATIQDAAGNDAVLTLPSPGASGSLGSNKNIVIDTTNPTAVTNLNDDTDSWSLTQSPTITWSASSDTGGTGVNSYELAIGTTSGGSDILSWTNIGNVTSYQASGLSLNRGTRYYVSIKAKDNVGNYSSVTQGDGWVVNSELYAIGGSTPSMRAIEKLGSTLFIGGSFTTVFSHTPASAVLNSTTGSAYWPNPNFRAKISTVSNFGGRPSVYSLISDNAGGYFMGGSFKFSVNGSIRYHFAHVKSDGTFDTNLNLGLEINSNIQQLLLNGTTLYISAYVATTVGGTTNYSARLFALDITTGQEITTFNTPTFDAPPLTLLLSGSTLFVGGLFTNTASGIFGFAALNATTGALITSFLPNISGGNVRTMAISGSILFLGGAFYHSSAPANLKGIMAVNLSDGSDYTSFNVDTDLTCCVESLATSGNTLYVGGSFTSLGGNSSIARLGAIDIPTNSVISGFAPNCDYDIYKILPTSNNKIYAAGFFNSCGATSGKKLALLDGTTGANDTTFNPSIEGSSTSVGSIALYGSNLLVGGSFSGVNSVAVKNFAALDTQTGMPITSYTQTFNSIVRSLKIYNNRLYVAGQFTSLYSADLGGNSTTYKYLTAIKFSDKTIDTSFNPILNATVNAMDFSGSNLYIGGSFQTLNGSSMQRLAQINPTTGATINTFPNPGLNNAVYSIDHTTDKLVVGGIFTSLSQNSTSYTRQNLVSLNLTDGSIDQAFDAALSGGTYVQKVLVDNNTLYAAGNFSAVGSNTNQKYIASVSTSTGTPNASFSTPFYYSSSYAYAGYGLFINNGTLFVSGSFSIMPDYSNPNAIFALNKSDGSLNTSFIFPSFLSYTGYNIYLEKGVLYLGGNLTYMDSDLSKQGFTTLDLSTGNMLLW